MHSTKKLVGTLLPLTALLTPTNNVFTRAYEFLDWLKDTNQNAWQILPLHETQLELGSPTKHVPSPYKSYGIGLDPKYLHATSLRGGTTKQHSPDTESRRGLPLFSRNDGDKEIFIETHKDWIHDYSLFCSLRDYFGTDDWRVWDEPLRKRDTAEMSRWKVKLKDKVDFYIKQQWQMHELYGAFHLKAKDMHISLIGDLPFYPSLKSPMVWAHQTVFQLDEHGNPRFVSGIPKTPSTYFGRQLWGHPLYNWEEQPDAVIAFWKVRLTYLSTIFDHIRFDHAKAFFSYGVMDVANAENDHYRDGPGHEIFKAIIAYGRKKGLTIFAEDSGDRTAVLRKSLKELQVPGLRIYRFALSLDTLHERYARIQDYPSDCVAYTTTHDTDTLLSYIQSLTESERKLLAKEGGIEFSKDLRTFTVLVRDSLIKSKAQMTIIPLQDWLLTTDRINVPGTEKEIGDLNWHYLLSVSINKLKILY